MSGIMRHRNVLSFVYLSRHRSLTLLSSLSPLLSSLSSSSVSPTTVNTARYLSSKPNLRGIIFDLDDTILTTATDTDGTTDTNTVQLSAGAKEVGRWLAAHDIPTALVTPSARQTRTHTTPEDTERIRNLWVEEVLGDRRDWDYERFELTIVRNAFEAKSWVISIGGGQGSKELVVVTADTDVKDWGVSVGGSRSKELLSVMGETAAAFDKTGKEVGLKVFSLGRRSENDASCNTAESLVELPQLIWNAFSIQSQLLDKYILLEKVPPPIPLTPANQAACAGHVTSLQSFSTAALLGLTKEDADANGDDDSYGDGGRDENTPLIWAAEHGHLDAVRYLLKNIPNIHIDHRGFLGATALSRAARRNHVNVLRALLSSPTGAASPDVPNRKLQYPLHIAAFHRNREAVETLLEFGANVEVMDRKGRRADDDTDDEVIREMIVASRVTGL